MVTAVNGAKHHEICSFETEHTCNTMTEQHHKVILSALDDDSMLDTSECMPSRLSACTLPIGSSSVRRCPCSVFTAHAHESICYNRADWLGQATHLCCSSGDGHLYAHANWSLRGIVHDRCRTPVHPRALFRLCTARTCCAKLSVRLGSTVMYAKTTRPAVHCQRQTDRTLRLCDIQDLLDLYVGLVFDP